MFLIVDGGWQDGELTCRMLPNEKVKKEFGFIRGVSTFINQSKVGQFLQIDEYHIIVHIPCKRGYKTTLVQKFFGSQKDKHTLV